MKLKRVLEYLHGTMDEFRVIGADDLTNMKMWVDASYAVHRDMKSHTGGVVSFRTGAALRKSSKQKLNTKSSTEAELVGASDYLPHAIWAKKFMERQGVTPSRRTRFIKTTKAPSISRKTGGSRLLALIQSTSTFGISSLRTGSKLKISTLNTVPQNKCLPIFLQNHYRETFSGD
jgi:hypothetical protein